MIIAAIVLIVITYISIAITVFHRDDQNGNNETS